MKIIKIFALTLTISLVCMLTGCFNSAIGNSNSNSSSSGKNDNGSNIKAEFAGGNGTESNPYIISEAYQWENINDHLSGYFTISKDLNMGDLGTIMPIGSESAPFKGYIDGNGHSISYATICATISTNSGLFGVISGGVVINLNFKESTIHAQSSHSTGPTGSFVGHLKAGGHVENCHTENIRCTYGDGDYAGGFAGKVSSASKLIYCSADIIMSPKYSSVSGYFIGGLVGGVDGGFVDACWASGTINVSYNSLNSYILHCVGGIIGSFTGGTVSNVYSEVDFTGKIQSVRVGSLAYESKTACYIEYGLSFCDFNRTVDKLYYSVEIIAVEDTSQYFSPTEIIYANGILQDDLWKDNKLWKEGKLHPVLVSYEDYIQFK